MFVLDALKGAVATLVGLWLGGRAGGYVLGAAAIVGHIFPVTRRFRGGKGVATGAGVLGVLHPIVAAVVAALWLALSRLTGKAAVASIAAVVVTPIGLALTGAPAWEFAATVGVCALLVVRHAGNIRRMLRREEHTLSVSRPGAIGCADQRSSRGERQVGGVQAAHAVDAGARRGRRRAQVQAGCPGRPRPQRHHRAGEQLTQVGDAAGDVAADVVGVVRLDVGRASCDGG